MTTSSDRTRIGLLIDESGSMSPQRDSVVAGCNEFIQNLARDTQGKDVNVKISFFDSHFEGPNVRTKIDKPINQCRELSAADYNPRGGTPLNDSIIQVIEEMGATCLNSDKKMLVIFTDGMENSSQASKAQVKEIIEAKKSEGWEFVFLGANIDVQTEGANLGFAAHSNYATTASASGMRSTMRSVSNLAAMRTNSTDGVYKNLAMTEHARVGGEIAEDDGGEV